MYQKELNGTITVFLSLILLLILSLLLTVIEGARVSTARIYSERALTTAMDSVLAEYYGPLWEEYHMFGYYGEEQGEQRKEELEAKLLEAMSYTFHPQRDLMESVSTDSEELYNIEINKVDLRDKTVLTDYEGKLFIYEAVEYMKYSKIGEGVEALLNKLSLLEAPDKVTYLMDEKMKLEEKLVGIDLGTLELMELFDGIRTNEQGIIQNSNGELEPNSVFVKKICLQDPTMEGVGINHEGIFQVLKPYYLNPSQFFLKIQSGMNKIITLDSQVQSLHKDCQTEQEYLAKVQEALSALEAKEKKTIADKRKMIDYKNTIKQCNSRIQGIQSEITDKEVIISQTIIMVNTANKEAINLFEEVVPCLTESIISIDKILIHMEKAKPLILQYETLLNTEKDNLEDEVYKGLEAGLNEIKRYLPENNSKYNFKQMKEIIQQDLLILSDTMEKLNQADQRMRTHSYQDARTYYTQTEELISGYQIDGLVLDYSTLVIDRTRVKSPVKEISNLLQGSILNLVIDSEKISKQELKQYGLLPSEQAALQFENKDFLSTITTLCSNATAGMDNLNLDNLFSSMGGSKQLSTLLLDGLNKAAELILFQEYLNEHFENYQSTGDSLGNGKPSVLTYEKEYLLAGKDNDRDNLAAIVTQIIAIRTMFDFASILGDHAKRDEAKLIAASLVGFTGLAFLVSIMQILILIVWSFAEALLDTCALMAGKSVPIIKNKIQLEFPELFLLNRDYLQQKASRIEVTQQPSLTYSGYLQVFLFMMDKRKLAFRSMDLIQENIRLRYQIEEFTMGDCIYGYEVQSEYRVKSKFTGISFIQLYLSQYLNNKSDDFIFIINSSYSY